MDKYGLFKKSTELAAQKFRDIDKRENIRIISHLDADGISACAILIKTLNSENRHYSVSIVPQLNEIVINELKHEKYNVYFFTDLGSGQLSMIEDALKDKTVFILDHHEPEKKNAKANITFVNPHLNDIDGSKEISGSGVVYLFCKQLQPKIKLAHIAVIGAIGDVQENKGFMKLNNEILEDAVRSKVMNVEQGLRFFGVQTRPLHKVLEYSTDPYIPGVSGSESSAIQFLLDLGIEPKIGKQWRKMVHLNKTETKRLIEGIVMKRIHEKDPIDVLGNIYTLVDEQDGSPTKDAREFATLLNSCGRLNKASLGIGTCLGDSKIKKKAISHLKDYKRKIIDAMNWFNENKKSHHIIKGNKYMIINAKYNILPTMIGTMASILSKSGELPNDWIIIAMARDNDGFTKCSCRSCGQKKNIDLTELINSIAEKIGGEAGGHKYASGAIFTTEKEESFIEAARLMLDKLCLEEEIK